MTGPILIYSRATPHHHTGGMETMAWSLAAELATLVDDVRIVTTAVPDARGPFVEDAVTVVPLADAPAGRYSRAWWAASRVHWRRLDTAPSVVLSVSGGAYSIVRDRSRHPRTPFVMQAHGTSMMELRSKLRVHSPRSVATAPKNALSLVRDLVRYRDFDRVIAVGDPVAASLAAKPQRWSLPPHRVRLIPNGVRIADHAFDPGARAEVRAALGIADDVRVVASLGRLHVQKRLDRAIRAAAVLRDSNNAASHFRFLLVGDGPDEQRLRVLVRELAVADLVTFVGRVDPASVRRYYAAADVALLTTARLEAGLPMAMLEALAAGLPCIVPVGTGLAELTSIHQVDVADHRLLAQTIRGVTRLRQPRTSQLPAKFSLDQCAREYLAVFDDIRATGHG